MQKEVRVHVLVSGMVQGVFFRQSAKEKADQLGIKGWIKNLDDGRVEAVFEGEKNKVEEVLGWIQKGGPPLAKVENLDFEWQEKKGDLECFQILF